MPPEGRLQMTRRSRLRPCSSLGPRAQTDPAARPGATARGEEAAGAAPPRAAAGLSPAGPATEQVRGPGAGLRRAALRSAGPARGPPRPRPAWAPRAAARRPPAQQTRGCPSPRSPAAGASQPQPRICSRGFSTQSCEPSPEAGCGSGPGAAAARGLRAQGRGSLSGRAGRRACEPGRRARLRGLAGSICSLPAGRGPAPHRPLLDPRREGWSRSGARSGRKSSPGSGSGAGLAGTKREHGWEALAGSLKNTPLSQGTHFSLGTAKLSHMKC